MDRIISDYLVSWKNDKYRKPLMVQGARQVGKTYSILEFGKKNYDNVAYFNFQTTPSLEHTFSEDISPEYLIPILEHICGHSIIKGHTLIFFDEIQLCERALTSLKYFCEFAPEYHVIAAGSLLGVAVNRKKYAFPVGKVDRVTMHPMRFDEYLRAREKKDLVERISVCFKDDIMMPEALHKELLKLYREYLVTGGMPEVVARFLNTEDYLQVRHVQETVLSDYLADMSKYQDNAREIAKTALTYNTVAVQLSKTNTRFKYKLLKTGARASEYENAIEWLVSGSLVSRLYRVEQIEKPLDNYKDIDDFKIYLSDSGLLGAQKSIAPEDIFYMEQELTDFKGGMTENYVNSQLVANGYIPYYWRTDKGNYEIEFIVIRRNRIIPIEVKSGRNVVSDSLAFYMKKYNPEYAIRLSEKNFGFENKIKSVPLYAAFCI